MPRSDDSASDSDSDEELDGLIENFIDEMDDFDADNIKKGLGYGARLAAWVNRAKQCISTKFGSNRANDITYHVGEAFLLFLERQRDSIVDEVATLNNSTINAWENDDDIDLAIDRMIDELPNLPKVSDGILTAAQRYKAMQIVMGCKEQVRFCWPVGIFKPPEPSPADI